MQLCVGNNTVVVRGASDWVRHVLDAELRYPGAPLQSGHQRLALHSSWDGWVRLLTRPTASGTVSFPTGLLGRVEALFARMRVAYDLQETRVRPDALPPWASPVPLFAYQREAAERAVVLGHGVIDLPPRAGKTRLVCEVVRTLGQPTLWVAPTGPIVRQTLEVLGQFIGERDVRQLQGAKRAHDWGEVPVLVCTAQTAARLPPELFATRRCLVVDEWHHAAAASYKALFRRCAHVHYRFGMTGTHFRSGSDAMAMEALLGETIYRLPSETLVAQGRLVPCDVVFCGTRFERMRGLNPADFMGSVGRFGAFEHPGRQNLVARTVAMLLRRGRHVLALVRTVAQGQMLADILEELVPRAPAGCQFRTCEFLHGANHRRRVDDVIASFNARQEVRCLVGTSLIGEGCDLPAADALVYAATGRAEVSLVQNAFRVCTAAPGKPERGLIVDYTDTHHRTLHSQALHRLKTYCDQKIFRVEVLGRPAELVPWLDAHHPAATNAAHPEVLVRQPA